MVKCSFNNKGALVLSSVASTKKKNDDEGLRFQNLFRN